MDTPKARNKIWRFFKSRRRMPTYSEMMKMFGYKSKNSVFRLIKKLIQEGVLDKDSNGFLLPSRLNPLIPLVGSIQAGFPSPAEEETADLMSLDEYLIQNPDATYLAQVSGDSMIEAGINSGDLILVDKNKNPKNGDIILAHVDNEWTLKFLRKRGSKISLVPANKKYKEIIPKQELIIGGIVTAVIRKYK